MFVALIIFLSLSMLGSVINVIATVGSRDYSSELKTFIIMLKMGWFAFALVLLINLCQR